VNVKHTLNICTVGSKILCFIAIVGNDGVIIKKTDGENIFGYSWLGIYLISSLIVEVNPSDSVILGNCFHSLR
jgi:hypothetical protein